MFLIWRELGLDPRQQGELYRDDSEVWLFARYAVAHMYGMNWE